MSPLCFILMPFGVKKDQKGRMVDFNKIYHNFIKVAVEACGLEPIRADEEFIGGIIHKPMIERLILCDYAIADLTSLNANVFYELGLRHAIKPHTTIPIYSFDAALPFDLTMQRLFPYQLDDEGEIVDLKKSLDGLIALLQKTVENQHDDSPVFQLIDGWEVKHNLSHEKTDIFRQQVQYDNDVKDELRLARNSGKEAVKKVYEQLKPINEKSVGIVIDLFLSLRAVEAYEDMLACYQEMDSPLQQSRLIIEQHAFALNKTGNRSQAKHQLEKIIQQKGPDPETNGILARVYKDEFMDHQKSGNEMLAKSALKRALETYKEGFDSDWRDFYPGINLVTLAKIAGNKELINEYLPVVEFSAKQKLGDKDYWILASMAEINIIKEDFEQAGQFMTDAISHIPDKEYWMLKTTINNFNLLLDSFETGTDSHMQLDKLIEDLAKVIPNSD
jgi:tetratricopeptide (TPR) repeat protein